MLFCFVCFFVLYVFVVEVLLVGLVLGFVS